MEKGDFSIRFEKVFGWELPLSILDQCRGEDQPYVLALLASLFLNCPASAERFLNGQMIQKTESKKVILNSKIRNK